MANPDLLHKIATAQRNPDLTITDAIQRYLDGESMQVLAKEAGITPQALYQRIRRYMLSYTGDSNAYTELITQALAQRVAEADERLEAARDAVEIARAREQARFARMDFERRRPKLYGQKQEIEKHEHITVVLNPQCDVTPYIDVPSAIIPPESEVVENQGKPDE